MVLSCIWLIIDLATKLSFWMFSASGPKPAKGQLLERQVDTVLLQLMQWLNIPKQFATLADWGLRGILALVVFIIFSFLARRSRIRAIVAWIDEKVGVIELKAADRSFFSSLVWACLWLPGLILILYVLRLNALLATVGISAGAIAAIAAAANRELLGNVFAGFALQARRQVAQGDIVKIMNISGTMQSIGLTSSSIVDFDGVVHFIPNGKLLNEVLTNYSLSTFRRVEYTFFFDIEEVEIEEVEEVLGEWMKEAVGQKEDKPADFVYGALNEKGQEVKAYLYFEPQGWFQNASLARRLLLDKINNSAIQLGVPQQLILQVENDGPEA